MKLRYPVEKRRSKTLSRVNRKPLEGPDAFNSITIRNSIRESDRVNRGTSGSTGSATFPDQELKGAGWPEFRAISFAPK